MDTVFVTSELLVPNTHHAGYHLSDVCAASPDRSFQEAEARPFTERRSEPGVNQAPGQRGRVSGGCSQLKSREGVKEDGQQVVAVCASF